MARLEVSDETGIPLKWVFALLGGASIFIASAVTVGMYMGSLESKASTNEKRIEKLEQDVEAISLIDRRLARIEGALGVKAPASERIMGVSKTK